MLKDWADISEISMPNILLGNGFGRTYWDRFAYATLLESVGDGPLGRYACTKEIFERLETTNFEEVLRAIFHAYHVSIDNQDALRTLYLDLRKSLIAAVNAVHPKATDVPCEEIAKCLVEYQGIFTTNYDLLPYWAILSGWSDVFVDFFWDGGVFNPREVEVFRGKKPIYFLHGAIHLQSESGSDARKVSLSMSASIDGALDPGFVGRFPLFITEGKSALKLSRIRGNSYLNFCYEQLRKSSGGLVVYGHDLSSEYDGHIIEAIKASRNADIAVSVFDKMPSLEQERYMRKVLADLVGCRATIHFFKSSSHPLAQCSA